jgi:class 3 adenylate cyclase
MRRPARLFRRSPQNRVLGTDILVSASTRKAAGADVNFRPHGVVAVKGRKQPVAAFELLTMPGNEGRKSPPADARRAIKGLQSETSDGRL